MQSNNSVNITFSTCWYSFKAKFDFSVYAEWIRNMLSNVRAYNLVIYTDEAGLASFDFNAYAAVNPRIRVVIKPFESFRNYALKDAWIANHEKNALLNGWVDWRVNALWSEKVHLVNETVARKYFDTDYYGCVNNDWTQIENCIRVLNHGKAGEIVDPRLNFIAGGFFMLHKSKAEWWAVTYDAKLHRHMMDGRIIKDDQQIITDCVFSNDTQTHFHICCENKSKYDVWFLFQRALL